MSTLKDVRLYDIHELKEENGNLSFLGMPFSAKRIFCVYGVRPGFIRGWHAHKLCKQFLIALSGSVTVTCDDGENRKTFTLSSPKEGLYIPPMIWGEQFYHSKEVITVGLADKHFDEMDYIRDYEAFKESKCV